MLEELLAPISMIACGSISFFPEGVRARDRAGLEEYLSGIT